MGPGVRAVSLSVCLTLSLSHREPAPFMKAMAPSEGDFLFWEEKGVHQCPHRVRWGEGAQVGEGVPGLPLRILAWASQGPGLGFKMGGLPNPTPLGSQERKFPTEQPFPSSPRPEPEQEVSFLPYNCT